MCTVSYIPTKDGFLLTSNRDENPSRVTRFPSQTTLVNNVHITYPKDEEKGGTWIATDEKGRAACLLNGAFLRHKKRSSYKESRGTLIIKAFEANSFDDFVETIDLEGYEQFTLLLIEPNSLRKIIWDGTNVYVWNLSTSTPHLWSSATLYSSIDHANKERYFIDALSKNSISADGILKIHGIDQDTPFIINHPHIKTVSITQLICNQNNIKLTYVLKKQQNEKFIPITFNLN